MLILGAEQLDETPTLDLVAELADVAAGFAIAAGQDDLAVLLWLGRRDQVQLQGLRLAATIQAQVDFAGQFIQVHAGAQLQVLGQQLAIERAVDALAGLVIVVVDQVVRVVHRDGDHGQTQGD
ncbi:hypothetical protein D9M71_478910 [compost metagenome]